MKKFNIVFRDEKIDERASILPELEGYSWSLDMGGDSFNGYLSLIFKEDIPVDDFTPESGKKPEFDEGEIYSPPIIGEIPEPKMKKSKKKKKSGISDLTKGIIGGAIGADLLDIDIF